MTTGDKLHKCSLWPIRNLQVVRGFNYQSKEYHLLNHIICILLAKIDYSVYSMYYTLNPVFYYNFIVCTFCRTFQKIYIPPHGWEFSLKPPIPFGNASYASCIALNCVWSYRIPTTPRKFQSLLWGRGGGVMNIFWNCTL